VLTKEKKGDLGVEICPGEVQTKMAQGRGGVKRNGSGFR